MLRMHRIFVAAALLIFVACSDEEPINCEKSSLSINVDQVINASTCSANDGTIHVSVLGGTEPYHFLLNDVEVDIDQLKFLTAGIYSLGVRDANHCSVYSNNVTILAEDFSFTTIIQPNTSCDSGNGSVEIDVDSDNPPYQFKLGDESFTSENIFNGLGTGSHTVTVRDNNNCMVTLTITVPRGLTGVSWASDIQPMLETNCAITGCHNGSSRSNDFRKYTSVKEFAKSIKSKTQDRSMPFDATLTQRQIDLIACWVDDGAFQN